MVAVSRGQGADGTVSIDADDIGGVVTSAKGPEAGVWVIAETTDLPTKFAKIVVTDDRGRYPAPRSSEGELQRLGARLRPGRFAKGASRRRARSLNLTAVIAPNARAAARILPRRATGIRCCRSRRQERIPRHGPERQRHLAQHEEPGALARDSCKTDSCWSATSSATRRRARFPTSLGTFDIVRRRPGSAASSRDRPAVAMAAHVGHIGTRARARACSPTGPTASPQGELPPAPPRPQGVERNVVITQWDWADAEGVPPRRDRHRQAQSRRSTPTASSTVRPRTSTDNLPVLDPATQHGRAA